jgi:hypothetical protein
MRHGTCFEILSGLLFCSFRLRRKRTRPCASADVWIYPRTALGLCHVAKRLNFSAIAPLVSRVLRSLTT